MSEIRFKRDTAFRKLFFVPDSFSHPAKMDAQLLIWIVERYTVAGETILDPMAGSGTTMLACTLGRLVVLVELEEKFCKMMRDNWERVKMRPQLGSTMRNCQIIQGDARQLEGLLVDKIVTSPPYADGEIDKIITSPPYEEAMGKKHHSPRADKLAREKSNPVTYTDRVDSIITSPPYEETIGKQGGQIREDLKGFIGRSCAEARQYAHNDQNIGNLKSQFYLEAMLQVYQQCYQVLKPEGLMILVTKNFIRNKQVIRLDTDTIKLCEQAGFKFLERHYRKLPSQSFWRIIYAKKHPEVDTIDFEDVLVFRK